MNLNLIPWAKNKGDEDPDCNNSIANSSRSRSNNSKDSRYETSRKWTRIVASVHIIVSGFIAFLLIQKLSGLTTKKNFENQQEENTTPRPYLYAFQASVLAQVAYFICYFIKTVIGFLLLDGVTQENCQTLKQWMTVTTVCFLVEILLIPLSLVIFERLELIFFLCRELPSCLLTTFSISVAWMHRKELVHREMEDILCRAQQSTFDNGTTLTNYNQFFI